MEQVRRLNAKDVGISAIEPGSVESDSVWKDLADAIDNSSKESGVAVATADRTVCTGVRLEGDYSQTVHPLELSVWKARSESDSPVSHVLIDSQTDRCGRCLQVVLDYSDDVIIRIQDSDDGEYKEFVPDSESSLETRFKTTGEQSKDSANPIDQTTADSGTSTSIPETAPHIDVEVGDDINVEYVRLNAPVYHLRYENHNQTFCGTDLSNRKKVTSSEEPVLADPCKMCHGMTDRETVEEQRERLRGELSERVSKVKETTSEPNIFSDEELGAILTEIPAQTSITEGSATVLREHLSHILPDIEHDQKNPNKLSRRDIEAILAGLDGEEVIPNERQLFVYTSTGRAARVPISDLQIQHRSGKGKPTFEFGDEEEPITSLEINPRDNLYAFTNRGEIYRTDAHKIPILTEKQLPSPVSDIFGFESDEFLQTAISCTELENHDYVVLATCNGYIKRTPTTDFKNIQSTGIKAIGLGEQDELRDAELSAEGDQILMSTDDGRTIRFPDREVRSMGRTARGVVGIEVDNDSSVAALNVINSDQKNHVMAITANGYGKRTSLEEYRSQTRNGRGLKDIKTGERNGPVVDIETPSPESKYITVTKNGRTIYTKTSEVSIVGRNTKGVEIIDLRLSDEVSALSTINK
jgi:DNA gyrase subunit A